MGTERAGIAELRPPAVPSIERQVADMTMRIVTLEANIEHLQYQINQMSDDLEEVEAVVQP